MLRVLGSRTQLCDGVTRRELMRVGGLSLSGRSRWWFCQVGDLAELAGRAESDGHVRHETARAGRSPRRVLTHRHLIAGIADLRTFTEHRAVHAQSDHRADGHPHL